MTDSFSSSSSIYHGNNWFNDDVENIGQPDAHSTLLENSEADMQQPAPQYIDNLIERVNTVELSGALSQSYKDKIAKRVNDAVIEPLLGCDEQHTSDNEVRIFKI